MKKIKLFISTVTAMETLRKILEVYMEDDIWFVEYDLQTNIVGKKQGDLFEIDIEAMFICCADSNRDMHLVKTRMLLTREEFWLSAKESVYFHIKKLSKPEEDHCESGYATISGGSHPSSADISIQKCKGMYA